MPRASHDGVSLRYEVDSVDDESARGPPIVFVGGVELGRWAWRWQREAFRGRRRVIVPFLRGTGPVGPSDGISLDDGTRRSDAGLAPGVGSLPKRLRRSVVAHGGGYAIADLAADLEAVLADDAALGRGRSQVVHLVGQGLGGAVALQCALEDDRRIQSLSLLGTRHGGPGTPETPEESRSQVRDPEGTSARERDRNRLRPFFTPPFVARNPHLFDRLLAWQDEQGPDAATRDAQWAAWDGFDPSDRLPKLSLPTLVIHGTADRLVPVENGHALAADIAESSIEPLEGAGHLAGVERPERVNDRIAAFVRSVERTDSNRTDNNHLAP